MKTVRSISKPRFRLCDGTATVRLPSALLHLPSSIFPAPSSIYSPLISHRRGYILLELVIALTIFSIAVLGLARTLGTSIEVANILNRDNLLRVGMRSFLEEVRRKPLADLATTYADTSTGITYSSSIEPVSLTKTDGSTLTDLYDLKVLASYSVGTELREESVSVYVYKPAQK